MNWSQRLLLVRLGAVGVFILGVGSCFSGAASNNDHLVWLGTILALVSVIVGFAGKLLARIVFRWHYEGSVGKGTRIWHD